MLPRRRTVEVQVDPKVEEFTRTQHKLLIEGEWVEAASGKTFETINPATEGIWARLLTARKKMSTAQCELRERLSDRAC
jgi:hypothetical protein